MSWETVQIGDLGKVITGNTPPRKNPEYYGDYKLFIKPTDIDIDTRYTPAPDECYSELAYEKYRKSLIPQGATCVVTIGSIGKKITQAHTDCFINQAMNAIVPNEHYDKDFVFYLLKNNLHQLKTYDSGTSSGRENVSKSSFMGIEVKVTKHLPTQQRIASILSAYDNLIENNLKRIKLLEEKAQLHYKDLMLETSEKQNIKEEYIKDCLEFYIGGGWGQENYKEGFSSPAYVIRGTDIPEVRGGNFSNVPLRFHKVSNLASRKMQMGDIVFEISNGQINNIGRTVLISDKLIYQANESIMCASFAKLIRVNKVVTPEYFYLFLNESQENGLLYQYKSNSANGINNFAFETFIDEVRIIIPEEKEMELFTKKVKPLFSIINTIGAQNTKLREARDILLPRLMNGEIDV